MCGTPLRLGDSQRYTVGAVSINSAVAPSGVNYFRIIVLSGSGVHISVGINPVALQTHTFIPRNVAQEFIISAGERVAAIRFSNNSSVVITWLYST